MLAAPLDAPIRDDIESFWRDPEHRQARIWSEHRDINEVMLATGLVPEGFLVLLSPATQADERKLKGNEREKFLEECEQAARENKG